MSEEERIKLLSKCNDIDCICQDCIYLGFVKNNILKPIQQENQELKRQLEYLRSGEYLNQLKFERNMLEDIVQNGGVSKEDKEFIDMTHRNTELLEKVEIMEKYFELIIDLGFDYDGCNTIESLKTLIDELVRLAKLGRACNIIEPIYVNDGKIYNIMHEKILGGDVE